MQKKIDCYKESIKHLLEQLDEKIKEFPGESEMCKHKRSEPQFLKRML